MHRLHVPHRIFQQLRSSVKVAPADIRFSYEMRLYESLEWHSPKVDSSYEALGLPQHYRFRM